MKRSTVHTDARRTRFGVASVAALALLIAIPGTAAAAASPVLLGTADSFVVLAGSGVSNTGPTTLNGDLGTFPTTTITGGGSIVVNGTNHAGDAVTQGAQTDLTAAYNAAAGEVTTKAITSDLGGQTLTPGVHTSEGAIGLTGNVTLDAGGDPSAVFVLQAGSTLTTASGSGIALANGAQACNVFWQVGTSATLGTGSSFRGSVLAMESVTVTTGATVEGRVLARSGAVTLDTTTITRPECATATATAAATAPGNQVAVVPTGGVSTGDGSTAAATGAVPYAVIGALVIAGLGGAALVAVRRRRLDV